MPWYMCLFAVLTGHLPYIGHKGTVGFLFCGPPVRTSFMEGGSQQFQKTAISQRCCHGSLYVKSSFTHGLSLVSCRIKKTSLCRMESEVRRGEYGQKETVKMQKKLGRMVPRTSTRPTQFTPRRKSFTCARGTWVSSAASSANMLSTHDDAINVGVGPFCSTHSAARRNKSTLGYSTMGTPLWVLHYGY